MEREANLRGCLSRLYERLRPIAPRWRHGKDPSEDVLLEWDLHDGFRRVLEEHGQFHKPTWRQLLSNKSPECYQHWRWDGVIPRNGRELRVEIRALHPLESFDIWLIFPDLEARVGFAPRGNLTIPAHPQTLEACAQILEIIEAKYPY